MLHTDKQTNKQTDKQINAGKNVYLLSEVNKQYSFICDSFLLQYPRSSSNLSCHTIKLMQVSNKASIGPTLVAAVTRFQIWTNYLNLTLKRILRSGSRCSDVEQPVPRLKMISQKSSGVEA